MALRRFVVWTPAVLAAVCAASGLAAVALQDSTPAPQPVIREAAAPTVARQTLIDFNTATATELATLPGIGASRAEAIVLHRAQQPFNSLADLADRGILRPSQLLALANLATVYVALE